MIYQIDGFLKFSKLENWENGCSDVCRSSFIHNIIKDATIPGLIEKCKNFMSGELLDDLIEANQLEFQVMENDDGYPASEQEMKRFGAGEIDLWLCDYSCLVDKVEAADLTDYFNSLKG